MKNKSTNHISISEHLILVGIGLAALYWILESFLDAFLFHKGTLGERILGPDSNEIWMRVLVVSIIIVFAVYGQITMTKRKKVERKMVHLNAVLRAISNVNQLIIKEKDPNRLLQGICDNLIETKGYYYVWIALMDESGIFVTSAQAGLGERLSSMLDRLKSGQIVNCAREALAKSHIIITDNIRDICGECLLLSECKGRDSVTIPLRHRDKVYGIIAASVPMGVAMDEEEQLLFQEVAKDIAFALRSIEVEEGRKRAEEALVQERNLLQALIDNIPDSIFFKDNKNRFIRVNKAKAEHSGTTPENMIGKTDFDFFPQEQAKEAFADDNWVMKSNKALVDKIEKVTHKDRTEHWISTTKIPRHNDNGRVIGTMGISRDITERKKVEKKLEEYSKRLEKMVEERTRKLQDAQEELIRQEKLAVLGQLAGGVGHELRNPLGVISNAVYYLKMILTQADDTTKEYLDMISSEVRNSEKIISGLLNLSRTRSAEKEEIAVSELVANTLENQPPPKKVKVTTRIVSQLPSLFIDPRQIGQVLINLIINAYQAMSEGGKLTISAQAEKEKVYLSITDTGCGISKENMKKLFEPLFTTKAKGIGLGLPVSKNLVKINGGSIKMKSKEGEGTTFTLILPSKEVVS